MTTPVEEPIVRIEPVVSEVVHVGEVQMELLPLTSKALADICRVPLPIAELRTAADGLTVMLASELEEFALLAIKTVPLPPEVSAATSWVVTPSDSK